MNSRAEEFYRLEEMIEVIPSWYERWGITLLSFVVLLFLLLAAFIKYPTVLSARIDIATDLPPVNITVRHSGIFVPSAPEGAIVKKRELLGQILNPAKLEDVLALKEVLNEGMNEQEFNHLERLNATLILGELQEPHSEMTENYYEYQYLTKTSYPKKTEDNLRFQINKLEDLNAVLESKKVILEEEKVIVDKAYERQKKLFAKKIISDQDFEDSELEWLRRKKDLEDIFLEIHRNDLQKQQLIKEQINSQQVLSDDLYNTRLRLSGSIKRMMAAIAAWEQKYLLRAPISGQVSYLKKFSENQYLSADEPLLSVVPNSGSFVGRVELPVSGSGKIKPDQKVTIRLDNYPYHEYGTLYGTVKNVSLVPSQGHYLVSVELPARLITSYDRAIPFKQHLSGSAQIITDNLSLLQRIFGHLRSLFDKNLNS
ncbi:HlyD family efflux transporter periplasmic adaptor subunit [Fulvivirga sp. M361]|uniref:HlyD family secretion protein n=1 Tax=Fulvivirga sp. M361 TaxID=2594266 RepID=UPI00117BD1BD|nr:HlyD family efflux transporter periplasmic adaptor subunit [Fulvivirga sp. M361]TRX51728.1 HlyD family efflux transporter periplasmic adaptor subunit [Fulvivirga sp. M361]